MANQTDKRRKKGSHGTGTIEKIGKNKFRYTIMKNKKVYRTTVTARNQTEARNIISKTNIFKEIEYADRGKIPFELYIDKWMKRRNISMSTYSSDSSRIENHIKSYFSGKNINEIYHGDISDFLNHLRIKNSEKGKPLAAKTVNHIILILHALFNDAVDDRRIDENPVKFKKGKHKLEEESQEIDHFNIEELNLFLDNIDLEYKTFFITAIHTGARRSEIIGLKWNDVDFKKGVIKIGKSKTRYGLRQIFMTPNLKQSLRDFRQNHPIEKINGYIFERDGKPLSGDGIVRSVFKRALRKAGLRSDLTFHSIRHSVISLMRQKLFPDYFIKKMVGHSTRGDITNTYTHFTNDDMRHWANVLGKLLDLKSNDQLREYKIG